MTITEQEKQQIIDEHEAKRKRELSARMSKLGRSRSPKKRKAVTANLKKALEKKWGKKFTKIGGK
jgi:hypothetical protein